MKYMKLAPLVIILFFVTACANGGVSSPDATPLPEGVVGLIEDFFPARENTTFVITSEDMPNVNQEVFTTIISGNRAQQRITAHNLELTAVIEHRDGALRQILSFTEFYLHENMTNAQPNMDLIILQEPLQVGTTWYNGYGGTSEITATNVEIITPAGTFTETIQVTTDFHWGDHSVSYFAKGYGMVHDSYTTTTDDITINVTTHLSEVRQGPAQLDVFLFALDDLALELEVTPITIPLYTNQPFANTIGQIAAHDLLFGLNVNSVEIDRGNDLVTVDFDQSFPQMGAGTTGLFLQGLANTFGYFLHLDNFRITIEGENFSDGHVEFSDDDIISVN